MIKQNAAKFGKENDTRNALVIPSESLP